MWRFLQEDKLEQLFHMIVSWDHMGYFCFCTCRWFEVDGLSGEKLMSCTSEHQSGCSILIKCDDILLTDIVKLHTVFE